MFVKHVRENFSYHEVLAEGAIPRQAHQNLKKKYPLFFQMGGVADFVSVQNFVTPGNLSSKYSTCFAQNAVSAGSAHLFDHKP